MKVKNTGTPVAHVVLASGPVDLHKGETTDMPEWVFKMLRQVFPGLIPAEVIVEAAPAPIMEEPKPVEAKNVKGKKSRK